MKIKIRCTNCGKYYEQANIKDGLINLKPCEKCVETAYHKGWYSAFKRYTRRIK